MAHQHPTDAPYEFIDVSASKIHGVTIQPVAHAGTNDDLRNAVVIVVFILILLVVVFYIAYFGYLFYLHNCRDDDGNFIGDNTVVVGRNGTTGPAISDFLLTHRVDDGINIINDREHGSTEIITGESYETDLTGVTDIVENLSKDSIQNIAASNGID